MNKKKSVTISDIAKRVGMTTITVSRALSKPDLVKPATLARILEVAREMDYVPNAFARGLKRSESLIIGVITASVESKAVDTLLGYRVAGIILSPVSDEPSYQPDYLERLGNGKTPVVLLDRTIHESPFSRVVLDNYHSGIQAAHYLLRQTPQLKRLLVLTGPEHSRITVERLKGLREVLAEHPQVQVEVQAGDYTLMPSYLHTLDYLAEHSAPDAIMGFNQLITLGALRALRMHNIPHDSLTICGIDRLPFADIFGVPIACVAHDASLAGSSAVRLLLDRLEDPYKPRDKVVIAGQLENG